MAEDFNASLVISTAETITGLRAVDAASKNLDSTLRALDKTIGDTQGNLDAVAGKMSELVRANTALIKSEAASARAQQATLKAEGQRIANQNKLQSSLNATAIAEAKVQRIQQQKVASGLSSAASSTRRDAESRARMENAAALNTERVAAAATRGQTAQENYANAVARREGAESRAALSALRLENAQRKATQGNLELTDSLSNSRYLLYDVGQTYTVLSAALLAVPVATAQTAISYQKDFAQVIRTNAELEQSGHTTFGSLRQDLKDLSRDIPLTFSEFSKIAAIAGQLGIKGDDVSAFTESVAKFGASSNVSLDEATTAFGRLQNSFDSGRDIPDFFNKIGSSIAYVGVRSAASESEIISVTNQISAAGAQFGFTADQIVGLSGALASVRIRPELARGAFQRIMLQLSRAADQGAESFNKFGKYTGLAADESLALFKQNPSDFFYQYVGGLKGVIASGASVSTVLDDIGAKNVFDKQFLLGLANGWDVYGKSLKDANTAFTEGTFLNTSTAGIFDTVDAKLKRISNSIQNLMDSIGSANVGSNGGLANIADTILAVVNATDRLVSHNQGLVVFIQTLLGLGGVIGVLLAFKAAQAFVLAGLVGFQQVLGRTSIAAGLTLKGNLQELAKTMLMLKGVNAEVAQSFVQTAGGMRALATSAALTKDQVAQINAGTMTLGTTAEKTGGKFGGVVSGLKNISSAALGLVGGPIGALITALGIVAVGWVSAREEASAAGEAMARAARNGADALNSATADSLAKMKVGLDPKLGFAVIGNLDKKLIEVARDAGVPFEVIVKAAQSGTKGIEDLKAALDKAAEVKGFKNYQEAVDTLRDPGFVAAGTILQNKVKEAGEQFEVEKKNVNDYSKAVGDAGDASAQATPDVDGLGDTLGGAGDEAKTASQKIDEFLDSIFGIANAEAAVNDSLAKLGAGLQKSSDVGTSTEGGRDNLKNFQDTLRAAMLQQQQLVDQSQISTEQASANYAQFVDGLVAKMASLGADPAQIQNVANQAKGYFSSALASGEQPKMSVGADTTPAQAQAVNVQSYINSLRGKVGVGANTQEAQANLMGLAQALASITGYPYQVVLDALTDPANQKSAELYNLITSITNHTYVAPVDADTSAAQAKVLNFVNFASAQLSAVDSAIASRGGDSGTLSTFKSLLPQAPASIAAPTNSAPAKSIQFSVPSIPSAASTNLDSLTQGYNDAADAANNAGGAGKQAGEDMADGIDEATRAADDFANRLKTGLTSAFDKQYGLTKAVDDYHSALNAIKKKRDDDLKSLDDLIQKQKELNNERRSDLVDARKAGIEKNISTKYGEVDRAADYAAQEKSALDSAAAKQKDIQANNAQIASLRAGIGNLTGYSDAAIANRAALRDLESKMIDMISAYAATGKSQQQVAAYSAKLSAQFGRDVTQVGYNRNAVAALTGNMDRYRAAVLRIPAVKPTKVTADTGGAMNAIRGVQNALNGLKPREVPITFRGGLVYDNKTTSDGQPIYRVIAPDGLYHGVKIFNKGGQVPGFASGGQIPGTPPSNPGVDNLMASVDGKGMVKVRSAEFIMLQRAAEFWGLDFMNALNNMKMPRFNTGGSVGGGSSSGSGSSTPMLVELTAENLRAILQLADRDINLFANTEKLASTVAEGNRILASKGVGS